MQIGAHIAAKIFCHTFSSCRGQWTEHAHQTRVKLLQKYTRAMGKKQCLRLATIVLFCSYFAHDQVTRPVRSGYHIDYSSPVSITRGSPGFLCRCLPPP